MEFGNMTVGKFKVDEITRLCTQIGCFIPWHVVLYLGMKFHTQFIKCNQSKCTREYLTFYLGEKDTSEAIFRIYGEK
jgi:hypothetical protein